MLPYQSVDGELSRLATLAQVAPATSPQRLTPSQLAVLASAMGRKHGVKVVFGDSRTAGTDGQTVVMPLTSKENSWIVRGYLDHEVGHVRLTDLNIIPEDTPLHKSLWNILEDVRIEKAMADLYPGMATNLRVLISQLRNAEPGIFEIAPDARPEAVITAYISLMLRSLYLGQPEIADLALKTREQFLNTFGQELECNLFTLIADIETTASTEDVVSLVGRIVDLLKQRAREKPPEPEQPHDQPQEAPQEAPEAPEDDAESDMPGEDKGRESGDTEQTDSPDEDGGDGQDGEPGQRQTEQDEPPEDSGDSSQQEDGQPGDSGEQDADVDGDGTEPADTPSEATGDSGGAPDGAGGGSVTVPDDAAVPADPIREAVIQALESQDEQADLGQQLKALIQEKEEQAYNDPSLFRIAVPVPQSDLPARGYTKQSVSPSTSVVAQLSSRLRGLLQAQALDHAKPSAAGSRIARSRLHRIKTGENKLFLRNDQVRQINTAIHLLVDNSGSMSDRGRFPIARDVTMALVKTLGTVRGVNLGVTIFPAFFPYERDRGEAIIPVAPILPHGRRHSSNILWPLMPRGNTPLSEAIRYVLTAMLSLTEPRKILVVLTDGEPNDTLTTGMALKEASDVKIEVVTLGIEDVHCPHLFPSFEIVKDVRELPEKTFRLLEKLLIK
jgi:cobaltochelatase CobT